MVEMADTRMAHACRCGRRPRWRCFWSLRRSGLHCRARQ